MILFLSYLLKNSIYGVCYIQISYEMVSNVHVHLLTMSFNLLCCYLVPRGLPFEKPWERGYTGSLLQN